MHVPFAGAVPLSLVDVRAANVLCHNLSGYSVCQVWREACSLLVIDR